VADHVVPHRGNRKSFEEGELQSLCARHHSVKTARGL
jgi:5-methylcytosine-specific restriction endonuclease McrA